MFFKKKKSGAVELKLDQEQFCAILDEKSTDVTKKYCVIANADTYNLLYRDGRFLGTPRPFGGAIYPFSLDPTKQGSNRDKKQFHTAKIVTLSKDFNLKVYWGTEIPFMMEDPVTREAYRVGARGVFYVNIDPDDAARKADMFYSKCLTQRNAELFTAEALRDFLREAFIVQIGARIQKYIELNGRTLSNYVGLQPSEILAISKDIFPDICNIFSAYGLSIVKESSAGSILQGLIVEKVDRA